MYMKIIFWTGIPRSTTRPIGVYQLSHWLGKHGEPSQVIDFCQWYSAEQLVSLTELFIKTDTAYIGVSTAFWQEHIPKNILDAINQIRQQYPKIKFVFGGPRVHIYSQYADIVIRGEAETQLLSLLGGPMVRFDITQLDHRFSARDAIQSGEVLPIELGRGCVFKCKFCAHHNLGKPKHTYQRCFHLVEEEIAYNYEHFNTTVYNFLDDTVNEDPVKVQRLSKIKQRTGVDLKWNGYLRADLIWNKPDTAEQLLQSGLSSCFFGIETLHRAAGDSIGKGWASRHAKQFLPQLYKDMWHEEISIWCNFIIGLPGETEQDLENTLEWCKANPLGRHKFVSLTLYQDQSATSEFSRNPQAHGYNFTSKDKWFSEHMTQAKSKLLERKFNQELNTHNRPTSWILFDLLNCKRDRTQLTAQDIKRLHRDYRDCWSKEYGNFNEVFLKGYVRSLKDLA